MEEEGRTHAEHKAGCSCREGLALLFHVEEGRGTRRAQGGPLQKEETGGGSRRDAGRWDGTELP